MMTEQEIDWGTWCRAGMEERLGSAKAFERLGG